MKRAWFRAVVPVESAWVRLGPVSVGHRRMYNLAGTDWMSIYWLHVKLLGGVSVTPPAWLLNGLQRAGWVRDAALTPAEVEEARKAPLTRGNL